MIMKKVFLFWLICCLSFSVSAQETILIDESFDQNNYNWYEASTPTTYSQIANGTYAIQNKTGKSNWIFKDIDSLDTDQEDFVIECRLRQLEGSAGMGFGLLFSMSPNGEVYKKFLITASGQFKIDDYYNQKSHVWADYTTTKALDGGTRFNTIKITRKANIVFYSINEEEVLRCADNGAFNNRFAFFLGGKMAIEVDYIKVSKSPSAIDVVTHAHTIGDKAKLSTNINSEYHELSPIISADGQTMYVCRSNHPENIQGNDIWFSKLDKNGEWTLLENIGRPLNNEGHNFVVSIAPDNNSMILANNYLADGSAGSNGLSMSPKTTKGWAIPKALQIDDFYNKDRFAAYYLCPDNKTLILSVKRDDSNGEKDLYVSFLQKNGSWSVPLNMGQTINTFENEVNPFVATDNKTLYFASQGHAGYGRHDLFVSKRLDDTWTNWSKPQNLGPKINSASNDFSIFVDALGDYAYICSSGDIWKIENPKKPDPTVLIKGVVLNEKTKQPMSVQIRYQDLMTGEELGIASSDPLTGAYQIVLPAGRKYSYLAEKEGFYAISNFIDVVQLEAHTEKTVNLFLKPIEKGEVVRLNNIFFEFDKAVLKPESYSELNRLFNVLNQDPNMSIEIAGHTDDKGSDSYNLELSQQRAKAVVGYLIQKGIPSKQLKSKGYGETMPLVANSSDESREVNRRVEFRIL